MIGFIADLLIAYFFILTIVLTIYKQRKVKKYVTTLSLKNDTIKELNTWKFDDLFPVQEALVCENGKVDDPDKSFSSEDEVDLSSSDFYRMNRDSLMRPESKRLIEKYGVGSCGPRSFYGTMQEHLYLEEIFKEWMECEDAITYPSLVSMQTSIPQAFANKNTLIIYDKCLRQASKQGIKLSRAKTIAFDHNDIEALERALSSDKRKSTKKTYVMIEGVYLETGNICPLKKIVKLCKKHHSMIIMDDTYGVGVLGRTLRGTWEHCDVNLSDITIVYAGMDAALGSMGATCYGMHDIIEFQRTNGSGYTFSASLPPYLIQAAIVSILRIFTEHCTLKEKMQNRLDMLSSILDKKIHTPIISLKLSSMDEKDKVIQALRTTNGNEKACPIRISSCQSTPKVYIKMKYDTPDYALKRLFTILKENNIPVH